MESSLLSAIQNNDLITLKTLVGRVSRIDEARYSIPLKSQQVNNEKNSGRDIPVDDEIPDKRLTLLHVAAFYNSLECFRYLSQRIGLRQYSADGFLPLHYACRSGAYEVALYILTLDPTQATLPVQGGSKFQLLFCATIGNDIEILSALFQNGARVDSSFNDDKLLIDRAIGLHNKEILTMILSAPNKKSKGNAGMTPAMRAVICHNPAALRLIYDQKRDLLSFYKDSTGYHTLISVICNFDSNYAFKEILIEILKKAGGTVQIEPPYKNQANMQGVCHWACKYLDIEVAALMFNTPGVLPNRLDQDYKSGAAMLAERSKPSDQKKVVEMLEFLVTKQQFQLNNRQSNQTPTVLESFVRSINTNFKAIEFLLRSGADKNAKWSDKNVTIVQFVKNGKNAKLKKLFGL